MHALYKSSGELLKVVIITSDVYFFKMVLEFQEGFKIKRLTRFASSFYEFEKVSLSNQRTKKPFIIMNLHHKRRK